MAAPRISPTKRTLSGPKASTPADWRGRDLPPPAKALSDAAEVRPDRASPTAETANRKTSRLEWVLVTWMPDVEVVFICSICEELAFTCMKSVSILRLHAQ